MATSKAKLTNLVTGETVDLDVSESTTPRPEKKEKYDLAKLELYAKSRSLEMHERFGNPTHPLCLKWQEFGEMANQLLRLEHERGIE